MSEPTKVTEGERVVITHAVDGGGEGKLSEPYQCRVFPKCDHNRGAWVCTTHGRRFSNQMTKDTHISRRGAHRLAWFCFECGNLQVP